ncbi:MAG: GNAT family N-acetyltransferase [Lachnospiraceae bacterium]|nr:GNAT family N-acetyltransferase [Lachnospiraceae bacterium]
MLTLEKVTGRNVWEILQLHVKEEQQNFVAGNAISIIEAYTTITGGGSAFPFGIYDDGVPVGFLMIGYDTDDSWENPPRIARNNYNLWRLMIDQRYQHKGYGKTALQLALDFINTMPCGKADYCWLSYEPENTSAKNLYHSFGFHETGEMDGEELIAILKLQQ